VWTEILANVTGRQILVPAEGVGAPLGDALIAGIGVGLLDGYRMIEEWTSNGRTVRPDPETRRIYDDYYRLYRSFYEDIKEHVHELAAIGGREE
jgi:xylulokinase